MLASFILVLMYHDLLNWKEFLLAYFVDILTLRGPKIIVQNSNFENRGIKGEDSGGN